MYIYLGLVVQRLLMCFPCMMLKIKIQGWFKPFIQHYAPLKANLPQCILAFSKPLPPFSIYFLTSQGKFGPQPSEILLFKPIKEYTSCSHLHLFSSSVRRRVALSFKIIPSICSSGDVLKGLPNFTFKFSTVCFPTNYKQRFFYSNTKTNSNKNSYNDSIISLSVTENETPEKTAQDYYPYTSTIPFQPVKMKFFSIRTLNLKLVTLDFK